VVDDAMSATGSVRWASALAARWAESGLSVSMFVLLDRRGATPSGIPLLSLPAGVSVTYGGTPGARLRRALPRSLPRLARAVARADVVVVTSEVGFSIPLSYFSCRVLGRPMVVMVQSVIQESVPAWVPRGLRRLWLHCIRHADAVVCVSHGSADSARELGVPPQRVSIAHSGIDPEEVVRQARSSPPEVIVRKDRPVLLSCAELSAHKGHDLLLRALAAVRERGYDAQLVILGEGPERDSLERLAADLGIAGSVLLPGFVRNPYPEMVAADLFCLASRSEAWGLCLLEAMALGVPTVATDAEGGGPRILLDGGRLGALVPPESVEALTEAIVRHLQQPEELRSRAAAGPAHATRFTVAAASLLYRDLFSRVTRPSAPAGGPAAGIVRGGRS
jgi:glycosyltransferase involved in cell wall biosynthesis